MTKGLIIFVIVVILNVLGLLLDLFLHLNNFTTITALVLQYPIVGFAIVGLQVVGVIGLFMHFFTRRRMLRESNDKRKIT